MIEAKNLTAGYEDKIIIKDLNLKIEKGQVVSIIGPNGCGKSTLLKTLSRMIKPMGGAVLLENNGLSKLKNKFISHFYIIAPLFSKTF